SVPVANRNGAIGQALTIHGNPERSTCLVLPTVTPANGTFLVEEDVEVALQVAIDLFGHLGHSILLDERKNRRLDGCEPWMEPQDRSRLAADLVLSVRLAQEGQGCAVRPRRRLDDVSDVLIWESRIVQHGT